MTRGEWGSKIGKNNMTSFMDGPYALNSKRFIDYLLLHSLEQINLQPTKGTNILELLITNSPEAVHNVRSDMGISDHGKLVHAEFNYFPHVKPLARRTFKF